MTIFQVGEVVVPLMCGMCARQSVPCTSASCALLIFLAGLISGWTVYRGALHFLMHALTLASRSASRGECDTNGTPTSQIGDKLVRAGVSIVVILSGCGLIALVVAVLWYVNLWVGCLLAISIFPVWVYVGSISERFARKWRDSFRT